MLQSSPSLIGRVDCPVANCSFSLFSNPVHRASLIFEPRKTGLYSHRDFRKFSLQKDIILIKPEMLSIKDIIFNRLAEYPLHTFCCKKKIYIYI